MGAGQSSCLDPDECLVRLRSVLRTIDRNQIKENPDATEPSTAYGYTNDNHGSWADIFLPLDGRTSNECPQTYWGLSPRLLSRNVSTVLPRPLGERSPDCRTTRRTSGEVGVRGALSVDAALRSPSPSALPAVGLDLSPRGRGNVVFSVGEARDMGNRKLRTAGETS